MRGFVPAPNGEEGVKIGNFVEVKKTTLGAGAKANHLTYLGDASIGAEANVGAGTITCNYDGFGKHETLIGEGAFIGSNTALVAPVSIGARAINRRRKHHNQGRCGRQYRRRACRHVGTRRCRNKFPQSPVSKTANRRADQI